MRNQKDCSYWKCSSQNGFLLKNCVIEHYFIFCLLIWVLKDVLQKEEGEEKKEQCSAFQIFLTTPSKSYIYMENQRPYLSKWTNYLSLLSVIYSGVFYYVFFFQVLVVTHCIDFMTHYWLVTHNLKNSGLEELTSWHSSVLDQHFLYTRRLSSVQGILW